MGRLDERVAVITGAGDGIGAGIARRFAEEGARVLIAEMNEAKGPRHRRRAGVDDRRRDACSSAPTCAAKRTTRR